MAQKKGKVVFLDQRKANLIFDKVKSVNEKVVIKIYQILLLAL